MVWANPAIKAEAEHPTILSPEDDPVELAKSSITNEHEMITATPNILSNRD
jgi:hypothetical protein